MEDIIVFTKTEEEHLTVLNQLFERLCAAGLTFKPDKVTWLASEVRYLGHVISAEGTRPDERELATIENFMVPKCVKDVQSILRMANYHCKFVRDFSEIAHPLTLRAGRPGVVTKLNLAPPCPSLQHLAQRIGPSASLSGDFRFWEGWN